MNINIANNILMGINFIAYRFIFIFIDFLVLINFFLKLLKINKFWNIYL